MSTEGKPIKCKALVARAPKVPMVEEEITVMPPKAGEVRVKVVSNACEWDTTRYVFVFCLDKFQ